MGNPIYSNLSLPHCLQQRGLCFWGCPIHFIRQYDLGQQRARAEFKLLRTLIEDIHARQIGWQHVGRELHPTERAIERSGQAACQHRLTDPRDIFDQHMPVREEPDYDEFYGVPLANHDLLNAGCNLPGECLQIHFGLRLGHQDFYSIGLPSPGP